MKALVYRSVTIVLLALISLFISQTSLIKNFERQTVDYRFKFRGMKSVHPDLILVLIEDKTQSSLRHSFDSFRCFAEIGLALKKLGAKVIGYDLQFVHQYPDADNALISNFFKNYPDIVLPCYFYQLYTNSIEIDSSQTDSSFKKFAWTIPEFNLNHLYQATEVMPPTDTILQQLNSLGHINVCPDSLVLMGHQVPLLINYQNAVYPSFAMEILRQYYDLDVNQLAVTDKKITIQIDTSKRIEIPVSRKGVVHINYLGDLSVFKKNCYSFIDILKLSEKIEYAPLELADYSIFKDKIVLVGKTTGEDIFSTPFSDNLPGIFLHTTLLSNILENKYIYELSSRYTVFALFILGFICAILIYRLKRINRFFLIVGLCCIYWLCCFILFTGFGRILNLLTPTIFLMLTIVFIFEGEFEVNFHAVRKLKFRFLQATFKETQTESKKHEEVIPFIRIVISLIKIRESCAIIHTIETEKDRKHGFSAFHRSPQSQNPFNCSPERMNKLAHDKTKLEQAYFSYLQEQCKLHLKPLELLKRIGETVYSDFGLTPTFKELYELSDQNSYINFVVDELTIPWHWAYHRESNTFLCDLYPLSYSLAIDRANLRNADSGEHWISIPFNKKAALFLYGTWFGEPGKTLKEAEKEINYIRRLIELEHNSIVEASSNVESFLTDLTTFVKNGLNLRIIHYTGHIENSRLDIDHKQYLETGTIQGKGLHFHSRPVVFLNGCNSGNLGHVWDKYDDLATEFLASGAAACIVTTHDIVETTARRFSEIFYYYFIQKGLTVGEALRLARIKLSNTKIKNEYDPECDITRYFYTLYGDPTVKF
ncbi:CHASE2 domain-containing protein [candidate division KSB1 bacterium]|nr:CHASE2 domain-containing protein [candidate division KSB1 bacterium]